MLRGVKELYNYVLNAKDGEIGRCKDFLFDDRFWTIRYMVADTGKWLPGRRILISPISLDEPDWGSKRFQIKLTKEKIENSPTLDSDAPVSRQFESKWCAYYGYRYYWDGARAWGMEPYPGDLSLRKRGDKTVEPNIFEADPFLRSAKEVMGYYIQAIDGEIGHVEDFILDDKPWIIRYMVVDTRNWLPGRKVLITPIWIDSVDWEKNKVGVNMTREKVKNSLEYDTSAPVNREYGLHL